MTGIRKLVEVTSSGLSHSQKDAFPWAGLNMALNTPRFYSVSEPFVDLNFGEITVNN